MCENRLIVQQAKVQTPSILIIHCDRVSDDGLSWKIKSRITIPRFVLFLSYDAIEIRY